MSKTKQAKLLGVSRSSLYYKSKLEEKDEKLKFIIKAVMRKHPAYGYRRVALELGINKKRAQRVMQKFGLKPARRSCKKPYKEADIGKEALSYPDITKLLCPIVPNVVWVSDFTYISFQGNFVYLCTIIDLFTREVLSSNVMTSHTSELVKKAFLKAVKKEEAVPQWFHSDQGSEYTSDIFLSLLACNNIIPSLTPKASPWRNGSQESFFGRFKVEFGEFERFESLAELVEAIYLYINYYNNHRIHSAIKDKPSNFKAQWKNKDFNNFYTVYESPPLEPPSTRRPLATERTFTDITYALSS